MCVIIIAVSLLGIQTALVSCYCVLVYDLLQSLSSTALGHRTPRLSMSRYWKLLMYLINYSLIDDIPDVVCA